MNRVEGEGMQRGVVEEEGKMVGMGRGGERRGLLKRTGIIVCRDGNAKGCG